MQDKLPMNKLLDLQQNFQAKLLGEKSSFQNNIISSLNLNAISRINIYGDGYSARLIETLTDNYSNLSKYIGSSQFYNIAQRYLAQYPSTFRSIRFFGDQFPEFLEKTYPKRPILKELAIFEWAINKAFDIEDQTIFTLDNLKNIAPTQWEEMRFTFHPSVSYKSFNYNITNIWQEILNNQRKRPYKKSKPTGVVFWRQNLQTFYRSLSKIDEFALTSAMKGKSFAEICEGVCALTNEKEAPALSARLLMEWINAGLISDI